MSPMEVTPGCGVQELRSCPLISKWMTAARAGATLASAGLARPASTRVANPTATAARENTKSRCFARFRRVDRIGPAASPEAEAAAPALMSLSIDVQACAAWALSEKL